MRGRKSKRNRNRNRNRDSYRREEFEAILALCDKVSDWNKRQNKADVPYETEILHSSICLIFPITLVLNSLAAAVDFSSPSVKLYRVVVIVCSLHLIRITFSFFLEKCEMAHEKRRSEIQSEKSHNMHLDEVEEHFPPNLHYDYRKEVRLYHLLAGLTPGLTYFIIFFLYFQKLEIVFNFSDFEKKGSCMGLFSTTAFYFALDALNFILGPRWFLSESNLKIDFNPREGCARNLVMKSFRYAKDEFKKNKIKKRYIEYFKQQFRHGYVSMHQGKNRSRWRFYQIYMGCMTNVKGPERLSWVFLGSMCNSLLQAKIYVLTGFFSKRSMLCFTINEAYILTHSMNNEVKNQLKEYWLAYEKYLKMSIASFKEDEMDARNQRMKMLMPGPLVRLHAPIHHMAEMQAKHRDAIEKQKRKEAEQRVKKRKERRDLLMKSLSVYIGEVTVRGNTSIAEKWSMSLKKILKIYINLVNPDDKTLEHKMTSYISRFIQKLADLEKPLVSLQVLSDIIIFLDQKKSGTFEATEAITNELEKAFQKHMLKLQTKSKNRSHEFQKIVMQIVNSNKRFLLKAARSSCRNQGCVFSIPEEKSFFYVMISKHIHEARSLLKEYKVLTRCDQTLSEDLSFVGSLLDDKSPSNEDVASSENLNENTNQTYLKNHLGFQIIVSEIQEKQTTRKHSTSTIDNRLFPDEKINAMFYLLSNESEATKNQSEETRRDFASIPMCEKFKYLKQLLDDLFTYKQFNLNADVLITSTNFRDVFEILANLSAVIEAHPKIDSSLFRDYTAAFSTICDRSKERDISFNQLYRIKVQSIFSLFKRIISKTNTLVHEYKYNDLIRKLRHELIHDFIPNWLSSFKSSHESWLEERAGELDDLYESLHSGNLTQDELKKKLSNIKERIRPPEPNFYLRKSSEKKIDQTLAILLNFLSPSTPTPEDSEVCCYFICELLRLSKGSYQKVTSRHQIKSIKAIQARLKFTIITMNGVLTESAIQMRNKVAHISNLGHKENPRPPASFLRC